MRKIIVAVISFILLCVPVFGSNVFNPNTVTSTDIINYIDKFNSSGPKAAYAIGRDRIEYYMTFLDEERDYYGLPFNQHLTPNTSLPEQSKQINPVNLKVMYTHNPSVYDNAVPVSQLSGKWYDIQVKWDNAKGKWVLSDSSKNIIFNLPTDDKRGEWTISVKGTDTTGKPIYDKEAIGSGTFRVHKPPVPMFTFTDNGTTATLTDAGSYDIDYNKSKPNNGIKNYTWSAKIGNNWVDVGSGKSVTFNKNGQQVSDYRLTVEDYDGAFSSISKSNLILDKPIAEMYFRIKGYTGSIIDYAYYGNVGNERVYVSSDVSWNDDAYNSSIYPSTGTRTTKFTALRTSEHRPSNTTFTDEILNSKFTSLINNGSISVELEAKNKYDLYNRKQKNLRVYDITGTQSVISDTMIEGKFIPGTQGKITFNLTNSNVKPNEITVIVNGLGLTNKELSRVGSSNKFDTSLTFPDFSVTGNTASYNIEILSKRDGTLLHRVNGSASFIVPLSVEFVGTQYYIPDSSVHIDVKTNKYVDSLELILFNGSSYQKVIPNATKYKDTGEDRFWTVTYKPPKDIPLKVYQAKAIGKGVGGLTKEATADMHYFDMNVLVHHTDEWENHRVRYNNYKTGTNDSPRTKDIFFNGERFMLKADPVSSITGFFQLLDVKVTLNDHNLTTNLVNSNGSYTGSIFDESFKYKWIQPNTYNLKFTFTATVNGKYPISKESTIVVDSTDRYWRDHLKE